MARDFNAQLKLPTRAAFGLLRAADLVGLSRPLLKFAAGRLPIAFDRMMTQTYAGYTPSERDVFVATYPKAGNNWMMQIATQVVFRGDVEFEHIHDLVAWPHAPVPELIVPLDAPTHERSPTGMRVIKTQLKHPGTPYSERAQYLSVLRDPKDTLVSMVEFANGIIGGVVDVRLELEDLHAFVVADRMPFCWAEHAASWWAMRDEPNVGIFPFQEMKRDLSGVVERIAAQLGVTLSPSEHAVVVERSGFTWMKANEPLFAPPMPHFRAERAQIIHKGRVGRGKERLNDEQRRALDAHYLAKLERLGSDLPYREMFAEPD